MNDESKSNPGQSDPQKPIPSGKRYYWWFIYLFLGLLLLLPPLLNNFSAAKEITWQQFENNMLNKKAVEKIVVVNNETAEVYIKKELANDSMFKDVFKPSFGTGINPGPHYSFNIGSVESFERKIDAAEKNFTISEKIP